MAKKTKVIAAENVGDPLDEIMIEPTGKKNSFLVFDLESFKMACDRMETELTPIEKVMAVELLVMGRKFYMQYEINYQGTTSVQGKNSARPDFLVMPELEQNDFSAYFESEYELKGLVVECDGKIHNESISYDRNRDALLTSLGYVTVRFSGEDIFSNFDGWVKPCLTNTLYLLDGLATSFNDMLLEGEKKEREWLESQEGKDEN